MKKIWLLWWGEYAEEVMLFRVFSTEEKLNAYLESHDLLTPKTKKLKRPYYITEEELI